MKRTLAITIVIGLAICLAAYAQSDPNSISDPNTVEPSAIKLPEGAKMPVQLKCPVHSIIGKAFIAIDTDNGTKVHCTQCVKTFISEVFAMNLPNLEVVK